MPSIFPFTALVGQERMKRAMILNAVHPQIGGVLIRGERGTAKSTAARAQDPGRDKTDRRPGTISESAKKDSEDDKANTRRNPYLGMHVRMSAPPKT